MIIEQDDKFIVEIEALWPKIHDLANFFFPDADWIVHHYIGLNKFSFTNQEMALKFHSQFGKGRI